MNIFTVGICLHFKTYWNVILFAVVPDHSPLPALVPDPANGQGNGKDAEPKKDINILTYTAGRMAYMGSVDTRQARSSSMQGIVKLLHLVFCTLFISDFLFSHDLNLHCCLQRI